MSSPTAGSFDPLLCARRGERLAGRVSLAALQRLVPLLAEPAGEAVYVLEGGVDVRGVHYLRGRVRATLTLQCQRCLQPMVWPVDAEPCLALLPGVQHDPELPEGYEPFEWPGGAVEVATLIEDELLLALPIVARHELRDCPAGPDAYREAPAGEHPFAVLGQIKPEQTRDP